MAVLSALLSAYRSWRRLIRCSVRSSPTSPKSRKTMRPVSGSTRTFPGWGAPWENTYMRRVPGRGVAVEEPVDEDLPDEGPDEHAAEVAGVEAGGPQAVGVGQLDAIDELRGQDALAGAAGVDDRDVDLREPLHRLGDPPGVVRLVAI